METKIKLPTLTAKNFVFGVVIFGIFLIINFTKRAVPAHQRNNWGNVALTNAMFENDYSKRLTKAKLLPNKQHKNKVVLVFLKEDHSKLGQDIIMSLESARFKFHTHFNKNLPTLISMDKVIMQSKGQFAVVIFEDAGIYFSMNEKNRAILDKYCADYKVGVVMFKATETKDKKNSRAPDVNKQFGDFPMHYTTHVKVKNYLINRKSPILRIIKPGYLPVHHVDKFTAFVANHSLYEPLIVAKPASGGKKVRSKRRHSVSKIKKKEALVFNHQHTQSAKSKPDDNVSVMNDDLVVAYHDRGLYDKIQRVVFGADLKFWLHKPLLLDALGYLSHGKLELPLDRFMQVDIDDIFVGAAGTRMKENDVQALVEFQDDIRKKVPGFSFQLGFSGGKYKSGTNEEQRGDEMLLQVHGNFSWFPHMWSHNQAHKFNDENELCQLMEKNKLFAEEHNFDTSSHYSVAPFHSGVFPVHEQLYNCWRNVWGIRGTSTEEYPHLRPDHMRRGFVYKDIMVMPRTLCGLFTHNLYLDQYPGGPQVLEESIAGGDLFQSFLYNKFNIFMTHLSNYGNDRLALYAFGKVVDFIQSWTNLKLQQIMPLKMAEKYFELYPNEKDPIWLNPCLDDRHKKIWSKEKIPSCNKFKFLKFIIVGPQKTGSKALHELLLMDPNLETSLPSLKTFEEIQFYNTENYMNGIEWYLDFFREPSHKNKVLFEKSASYFDNSRVPQRLSALLPKAKIVILLVEPAWRAYSWYQHLRDNNDQTAMTYNFYDVILPSGNITSPALLSLRDECLKPGLYAEHIERWLQYVPSKQIIIEDGSLLKSNPVKVIHRLQKKLQLKLQFDYSELLRLHGNGKKVFFCHMLGNENCGKDKERKYADMSPKSQEFLKKYFKDSNVKLLEMLQSLNQPIPLWLQIL